MEASANARMEVQDTDVLVTRQTEEASSTNIPSKFLSHPQLELLKNNAIEPPETETKALTSSSTAQNVSIDEKDCGSLDSEIEEIMKELRALRRQNTITHWLLSIMIGITAFWQLSEVSLLLALKAKVKNPFRAIGGLIMGSFRRPNELDAAKSHSSLKQHLPDSLSQVKMPEFPHVDVSSLGWNGGNGARIPHVDLSSLQWNSGIGH